MKIAACVIVKDEERDFLEWLCFHLAVGFDTILVYDNMSTDRTVSIANRASYIADVRVRTWNRLPYQRTAYDDALARHRAEFDWIAFIDSDEFLFSPSHHNIKDQLAEMSRFPAIGVHWLCYGSNGHTEFSPNLVIEQFTRRGLLTYSANRHVKTIVRPSKAVRSLGGHIFELVDGADYYLPSGAMVSNWSKPGKLTKFSGGEDKLRINHYQTRTLAHYRKKLARGDLNPKKSLEDRFASLDCNDVVDTAALDYADEVKRLMRASKFASKAVLAARTSNARRVIGPGPGEDGKSAAADLAEASS